MQKDPEDRRQSLKLSSGGRSWLIVLRGARGMAIDNVVVRWTGISLVTLQYALARGDRYQATLLLTTIGRKSGQPRSHALAYYPDGDRVIVIGTHGGSPHDPDWVWNLRSQPKAFVHIRGRRHAVIAQFAEGAERSRLYDHITAFKKNVYNYHQRAEEGGRLLPFVVLTRQDGKPLR
jgi:deazaflavin-dependent oxidoreductase (nitroreductase family)